MNWIDICGCPGSGKSSLAYPVWGDREITEDGKLPPVEWHDYCNEVSRLLYLLEPHQSIFVPMLDKHIDLLIPAVRMNARTMRKMSAVARAPEDKERGPFYQSAFMQRILGFGWRLAVAGGNLDELRHAIQLMPASLGVVFLTASKETLIERNRARRDVPETAHEDRSYQIVPMLQAIEVAKDELSKRSGFQIAEIDVENQTEDEARAKLVKFSKEWRPLPNGKPLSGDTILSPPVWWQ